MDPDAERHFKLSHSIDGSQFAQAPAATCTEEERTFADEVPSVCQVAITPTEISAWPEDLKHKLERGQREVYEYCNSAPRTTTKGLGKTRGKSWTPVWQTQWDKSSKGGKDRGRKGARPAPKGGKGKTPKGKGKGQWPDAWAFKDPKGKAFCRDYHLTSTCPGSCGRSHNCPVRKGGWVCNASPDKQHPG